MLWLSEWTARWPGGALHVRAPGPFTIGLYYFVLIAWTARLFSRIQLRPWIWATIAVLGVASAVEATNQYSRSTFTVLPLGGGHSIFVDSPGNARDMLVDCGNEGAARLIVKSFLQSRGVNQLSQLVLTHGDVDHVGGFETIMNVFEPRRILAPAVDFRSPFYRKSVQVAEGRGRAIEQLTVGSMIANWSVLYPSADDKLPRADDKGLVLRGTIRGTRVLLLPDLGSAAQEALIERNIDLRSDIVVSSVPGSGEPLTDPLLDLILPRAIVMADATYPPDARARPPLRERLARRGVPVFYASEVGAVTVEFSDRAATVRPARETEIRKPLTLRLK